MGEIFLDTLCYERKRLFFQLREKRSRQAPSIHSSPACRIPGLRCRRLALHVAFVTSLVDHRHSVHDDWDLVIFSL